MKLIILSLIKDEQRYLEEWIEYHHNIGVDNFILVEDFNSSSHKIICDKYNYVKLYKIEDFLDKEYCSLLKSNTNNENNNRQHYIFLEFLEEYKKSKYDGDWLIFIDVDEFIEINNHKYDKLNLKNIIDKYYKENNNIEELLIKWEYMTLENPFIDLPYKYSVFDTYKKISKIKPSKYISNKTKIILNLNNLNWFNENINIKTLKYFPHHIKLENVENIEYSDARLNHYMTKTWEEYYNRLINKGEQMNMKANRTFENFFDINSHLPLSYKKYYLYKVKGQKVKINNPI